MTFLQIFLAGFCLRAGWFAFNFIQFEIRYLRDYYFVHKDVREDLYRSYWDKL